MSEPKVEDLSALLAPAQRVLVFTGAGVSTASNIPDFRGPNGLFRHSQPVDFPSFVRSDTARREYWTMKLASYRAFVAARPNPAHLAIVELERQQRLEAVVTQNVDGLHAAAGTSRERLIELHGTNLEVECLGCDGREPWQRAILEFERSGAPPRCASCGELVKPAVVMFGQALDPAVLERARVAAARADLVLALGSSLVVRPAADVPLWAARQGAPYVIVNRGETPHDALATLRIDADVSAVLPAAVRAALQPV